MIKRIILKMCKIIIVISLITGTSIGFVRINIENKEFQENRWQETPNEKFVRKGGKVTQIKVIFTEQNYYTANDIAQGRELSLYESAGPYEGGYFPMHNKDPKQAINGQVAAREFIWQHWQEKTKGYLIITFRSVDAISTTHLFIEPDEVGNWCINRRIVRHYGEIDDIPKVFSVERVKLGDKDRTKGISQDSTVDPSSYILIFKDKDGENDGDL